MPHLGLARERGRLRARSSARSRCARSCSSSAKVASCTSRSASCAATVERLARARCRPETTILRPAAPRPDHLLGRDAADRLPALQAAEVGPGRRRRAARPARRRSARAARPRRARSRRPAPGARPGTAATRSRRGRTLLAGLELDERRARSAGGRRRAAASRMIARSPGGPWTASGRSRPRRSKVFSMPGRPSQWSAWKWVMKMSVRSASPTERSSWRCVPSPQSNRIRSPPRRTSSAGSPRRAVGTEPAGAGEEDGEVHGAVESSSERDELEASNSPPVGDAAMPIVWCGRAAPLGRAAGVEDLEAVGVALVQRDVRVAEDDRVGAGKRGRIRASRPAAGPASWTMAILTPSASTIRARGQQQRAARAASTLPWTAARAGRASGARDSTASGRRSRRRGGSGRPPAGARRRRRERPRAPRADGCRR